MFKQDKKDENLATFDARLHCDMNDPDQLEIGLLEMAHDLQMSAELDDGFHGIGRNLKPLLSGYCEALRVHNASGDNNAIFMNSLVNFAVMSLSMAIAGCAKPSAYDKAVKDCTEGVREGLENYAKRHKANNPELMQNAKAIDGLDAFLAKFMANKNLES